jgi:eukaryotic-like serine/threonine-protein kinase
MDRGDEGLLIGDCVILPAEGKILAPHATQRIGPRPMALLMALAARPGRVLSRDELMALVWPDVVVSDETLSRCVADLRQALGDDPRAPRYVETLSRRGYRLIAKTQPAASEPQASPLSAGDGVPHRPHWRLVKRLSPGSHGEVWLAEHEKIHDRRHVFKFSLDAGGLGSLKREVTLYRLLHDALGQRRDFVQILDWNFESPPYFVETEYVPGGSLLQWFEAQGGPRNIPLDTRLELVASIADALADAHGLGVLHKDLKPGNVLIELDEAQRPYPRLTDFGVGALLDPDRLAEYGITRLGLTQTRAAGEATSGTPLYLAPEVLAGRAATAKSDIYALGVLLYQLVVGDFQRPLTAGWEADVDDDLLREDIALAANGNPLRRLGDARVLAEGLRSLAERREARARERNDAARAAQAEAALARMRARRPWMWGAAAALLAGTLISTWLWLEARDARGRAEHEAAVAAAVNEFLTRDLLLQGSPEVSGDPDIPASELVRRATSTIGGRFSDSPRVESALRLSLGSVALAIGAYDDAQEHIGRVLELAARETGELHAAGAEARTMLASLQLERGDLEDSARTLALVLQSARTLPAELTLRARLLEARLAAASDPYGVFQMAESLEADARGTLGDEHWLSLLAGTYRAMWLRDGGRLQEALEKFSEMLERHLLLYSDSDLRTAEVRRGLAGTYHLLGDNEAALPHIEAVHESLLATLGAEHHRSLGARADRASIYGALGRHEEALAEWLWILEIREQRFGRMHPETRISLNNLANIYAELGRNEEALAAFEEAHRREVEQLGEAHPYALQVAHNVARTLQDLRRYEEAAVLQTRTVELARVALPADDWIFGVMLSLRGALLLELHREQEALPSLQEGVTILRTALGEEHPVTARYVGLLTVAGASTDTQAYSGR